mgnify:CR=1 FL=1
MKTILILAVLGAALWFGMKHLQESAVVKQAQDAPLAYTKSLQEDVARAKRAAAAAEQAGRRLTDEVQKAADAAQ